MAVNISDSASARTRDHRSVRFEVRTTGSDHRGRQVDAVARLRDRLDGAAETEVFGVFELVKKAVESADRGFVVRREECDKFGTELVGNHGVIEAITFPSMAAAAEASCALFESVMVRAKAAAT